MSKSPKDRANEHLWDWSLTLQDPKDANEYRFMREQRISRTAGHVHALGLVIGIMGFITNQFFRDTPRVVQFACAFRTVVLPAIPVYLSQFYPSNFTRWYDLIVILNQASMALLGVFSVSYLGSVEEDSVSAALDHLFFYSPLAVLFTMTVVHRTTFRTHFPGQLLVAFLSHGWVYSVSVRMGHSHELLKSIDFIGWSCESFFAGMGFFHLPHPQVSRPEAQFPPWMVAGFFHYAVGLVIPCTVKYILECYGLAKFLAWKYHEDAHRLIWSHFMDGLVFAGSAGMTLMLGGWIVFRSFAV